MTTNEQGIRDRIRQATGQVLSEIGEPANRATTDSRRTTTDSRRTAAATAPGVYPTTHDPAVGETTGVTGSAVRVLPDGRRVLSDVVDHLGSVGRLPVGGWAVCTVGVFGGRAVAVQLTAKGEWTTRSYDSGRWDTEEEAKQAAGDAAAMLAGAADRWERLGRDGMAERVRAQLAAIRVVAG